MHLDTGEVIQNSQGGRGEIYKRRKEERRRKAKTMHRNTSMEVKKRSQQRFKDHKSFNCNSVTSLGFMQIPHLSDVTDARETDTNKF